MRRLPHHGLRSVCILLIVGAVLLGVCATPAEARSLEEIKASGELRVCIAPTSPASAVPVDPSCREDCAFGGPVPREVMAFANSLGGTVRVVFNQVEWDEQFHDSRGRTDYEGIYTPRLLETGKCDIYPSHLTKNEWRSRKLAFAILFRSRMLVMVGRSMRAAIKTEADLAGKTVATELNSSFHTWITEQNRTVYAKNPMVVQLMSIKDAIDVVEKGLADFTLVDADIALWEAAHSHRNLDVAFPVGPRDEIGWGVDRKDRDLRDAIQAFFDFHSQVETSELNLVWKEEFGVTLRQFQTLMQATR